MIFTEAGLPGAWIIEPAPLADERGFFARVFDAEEFERRGLQHAFPQCSVSYNATAGTLRGMHFQAAPHEETKLVRCTSGAIHDVIIDLRPSSPAYGQWIAVELSAENRRTLYVPEGFAHGFQTLRDASEVYYQISAPYVAGAGRGVRWDDPGFGIQWPDASARVMSDRDRGYPDWTP